ncbi:MAG: PTS transporter subunit EIIC, partial [Azoarcus sp.]|nr:PTS transporter subunit EIIC [Azoarcus sp.]
MNGASPQTLVAPGQGSFRAVLSRWHDRARALFMLNWAYSPSMQAIRNGFLFCLPLVTTGAIAVLLNNLPLPGYDEFMKQVFGEGWKRFGELVWQGTFGIISIPMLVGTSYHLAVLDNHKHVATPVSPLITALTALASIMIILPSDGEGGIIQHMGTQGLFSSILVSIIASRVFLKLARLRLLTMLIYSEGTEASIQQVFASLIPSIITVCLFGAFYFVFRWLFGVSVHQAVHEAILFPFHFEWIQQPLNMSISFVLLVHIFWFFGIHGLNVLDPLTKNLFASASEANAEALAAGLPLPNIVTKDFLDIFIFIGGSGSSLCLLLALFIASRNGG